MGTLVIVLLVGGALWFLGSLVASASRGAASGRALASRELRGIGVLRARFSDAASRLTAEEQEYLRTLIATARSSPQGQPAAEPISELSEEAYSALRAKLPSPATASDVPWPNLEMAIWSFFGLERGLAGPEDALLKHAVIFATCAVFGIYDQLGETSQGLDPHSDRELCAKAMMIVGA